MTSVGGTYSNSSSTGPEGSWTTSGGGFSTLFPTPTWQAKVVREYLRNPNLPSTSLFDKTGRGYPDVAAISTNFQVYIPLWENPAPTWIMMGGTSLSGPIWAGMITRLNLERLDAGLPAVGFLNPALYKLGRVGQDVTIGHNVDGMCYPDHNGVPLKGFPAVPGWDAVSGLGTPDFEFLLKNL